MERRPRVWFLNPYSEWVTVNLPTCGGEPISSLQCPLKYLTAWPKSELDSSLFSQCLPWLLCWVKTTCQTLPIGSHSVLHSVSCVLSDFETVTSPSPGSTTQTVRWVFQPFISRILFQMWSYAAHQYVKHRNVGFSFWYRGGLCSYFLRGLGSSFAEQKSSEEHGLETSEIKWLQVLFSKLPHFRPLSREHGLKLHTPPTDMVSMTCN